MKVKENSKHIPHTKEVDALALVKDKQSSKYSQNTYNDPWTIKEVQDNRTVTISKDRVSDVYNIQTSPLIFLK